MPRLPRVTGAQILAAVKKDGWFEVSQEGSHVQLRHDMKRGKVSVALYTGMGTRLVTCQASMPDDRTSSPEQL